MRFDYATSKPISHSSLRDSCDIGYRVQFNVEFPLQVMNFPIAYKEDKDTFTLCKSRGVRLKDPTSDLIFLRKTFLKPLSRVFFAKSCRRLKPVLACPDSCG